VNLTDFRSRVRALTGVSSTAILTDAVLDVYINEAYRDVCRAYDWPWLTATYSLSTAGYSETTGIQLPTSSPNIRENRILSVYKDDPADDRRVLTKRSRYTINDIDGSWSTGDATEFVTKNGYIFFYPAPGSETLKIDYLTVVSDLVATPSPTSPIFDSEFHGIVAYGAAVRVLIAEGDDTERRQYYRGQFQELLEQMREEYLSNRDKSTLRLGGRISWRNGRNTRLGN
jgi:hypothetical protein